MNPSTVTRYSTCPGKPPDVSVWEDFVQEVNCDNCGIYEIPGHADQNCIGCGVAVTGDLAEDVEPDPYSVKIDVQRYPGWWVRHDGLDPTVLGNTRGPFSSELEAVADALADMSPIPIRLRNSCDKDGMVYVEMNFEGAAGVAENDRYIDGSTWETETHRLDWAYTILWDRKSLVQDLEHAGYKVDQYDYDPTVFIKRGSLHVVESIHGPQLFYGTELDGAPYCLGCMERDEADDDAPREIDEDELAEAHGFALVPHKDDMPDEPEEFELTYPDLSQTD